MFDIRKKSVSETGIIELDDADDSPLMNEDGERCSVTVCSPGSKRWQQANAEKSRKATARVDKAKGKLSAAIDPSGSDEIDFLADITVSFNNWTYSHPDGEEWPTKRDMFRAAYADHSIGFIRQKVEKQNGEWGNFAKKSGSSSPSSPDNMPG